MVCSYTVVLVKDTREIKMIGEETIVLECGCIVSTGPDGIPFGCVRCDQHKPQIRHGIIAVSGMVKDRVYARALAYVMERYKVLEKRLNKISEMIPPEFATAGVEDDVASYLKYLKEKRNG